MLVLGKVGFISLDRNGFGPEDADAFFDFLKSQHSQIPIEYRQ